MKKTLFLASAIIVVLLAATAKTSFSQQEAVKARFIIKDARLNDVDITEQIFDAGAYLAIYTPENSNEYSFANVQPKHDTQSFGRMTNIKRHTEEETSTSYEALALDFRWSYINDYDNKKGTADVQLFLVKKQAGVTFECKIIPENLDVLVYKGYMEGTLKGFND
jgi:hypothetical protein